MEFQLSYFKFQKMMLWKCCTHYTSKSGKLSSCHRTGKCQFSFQSQRKAIPRNVQITVQLHSFHTPTRLCSKSFNISFHRRWAENFQMYKLDLEKQRNQRSNCQHSLDHRKSKEIPKNIYLCSIDHAKASYNKLWKILKEMGTPDHLTCLLRNLYAGQEATVRTRHGTTDWLIIGKGVHQGCILSPYLFNLYAEYMMQNAILDDSQAGIMIARRNINNLRYAEDNTLMTESKEELKSLLMKVKEKNEKAGL